MPSSPYPIANELPSPPATAWDHLLPAGAVVVEGRVPGEAATAADGIAGLFDGLFAAEAAAVARAVPKRQREFAAGRRCARACLRRLGLPDQAIGVGPQREPLFPAGISGSITHTGDYCAAAALRQGALRALGIDAEAAAALPPGVAALLLVESEQAMVAALAATLPLAPTLLFSIKEAFYKAFFQIEQRYLDPLEAEVLLQPLDTAFTIRVLKPGLGPRWQGRAHAGRWSINATHVLSAIALPA